MHLAPVDALSPPNDADEVDLHSMWPDSSLMQHIHLSLEKLRTGPLKIGYRNGAVRVFSMDMIIYASIYIYIW